MQFLQKINVKKCSSSIFEFRPSEHEPLPQPLNHLSSGKFSANLDYLGVPSCAGHLHVLLYYDQGSRATFICTRDKFRFLKKPFLTTVSIFLIWQIVPCLYLPTYLPTYLLTYLPTIHSIIADYFSLQELSLTTLFRILIRQS